MIRGSRASATLVVAVYAALSFVYLGWRLIHHPGRDLVGYNAQKDPEAFLWSFAWWPHAIASWTNPFVTHAIYAPVGIDLAWTTSVPALAIVFSPVTVVFGPAVAYNLAAVLLPVASAWTAFLLCRSLTGSTWASLIGGYLFGFSSFTLGHEYGGDLNLIGSFLVPLIALVLVKHVRGELGRKALTWRLGFLLGLEFWISTEIVATVTVVLLFAVAIGLVLLPSSRRRLAHATLPITGAFTIAAVLAAPLIYYTWVGARPPGYGTGPPADLLNLIVPTQLIALGGSTFAHVSSAFIPYNDYERDSYLGIPAIAILILLGIRHRRSAGVQFLFAMLGIAIVLASGHAFYVDGRRLIWAPWKLVENLSLFNDLQPQRFILYASLASAVAVALWIATTKGRFFAQPVILPLCAVASLVPAVTSINWTGHPLRVPFFTQGIYRACVPKGETLVIFPFARWGDSMLWQAESGFWFTIAEGNMGRDNYPPAFYYDPLAARLQFQVTNTARLSTSELRSFVRSHRVDRIVSASFWPTEEDLGPIAPATSIGSVAVAPACGLPPLAHATG